MASFVSAGSSLPHSWHLDSHDGLESEDSACYHSARLLSISSDTDAGPLMEESVLHMHCSSGAGQARPSAGHGASVQAHCAAAAANSRIGARSAHNGSNGAAHAVGCQHSHAPDAACADMQLDASLVQLRHAEARSPQRRSRSSPGLASMEPVKSQAHGPHVAHAHMQEAHLSAHAAGDGHARPARATAYMLRLGSERNASAMQHAAADAWAGQPDADGAAAHGGTYGAGATAQAQQQMLSAFAHAQQHATDACAADDDAHVLAQRLPGAEGGSAWQRVLALAAVHKWHAVARVLQSQAAEAKQPVAAVCEAAAGDAGAQLHAEMQRMLQGCERLQAALSQAQAEGYAHLSDAPLQVRRWPLPAAWSNMMITDH